MMLVTAFDATVHGEDIDRFGEEKLGDGYECSVDYT